MMIDPPLNELLAQVDCRYTLVSVISKRARQIVDGQRSADETGDMKPVAQAVEDLMDKTIEYQYAPGTKLD